MSTRAQNLKKRIYELREIRNNEVVTTNDKRYVDDLNTSICYCKLELAANAEPITDDDFHSSY